MWDEESFRKAVIENNTVSGVLRSLQLSTTGGRNFQRVHDRIKTLDLDTSHWLSHQEGCQRRKITNQKKRIEDILVQEVPLNTNSSGVKARLINEKVLPEVCAVCGISSMWNNMRLVLALDHINGNHQDYRLENLRLLCPNCHSQTHTFAGRKHLCEKKVFSCPCCGHPVSEKGRRCRRCSGFLRQTAVYPPREELQKRIQDASSIADVARQYKVSPPTIRRWAKKLDILRNTFPRSYTKHDPNEKRVSRSKQILALRQQRCILIQESGIDFRKRGWVNAVAKLFGITRNHVSPWIRKHKPEIWKICYRR